VQGEVASLGKVYNPDRFFKIIRAKSYVICCIFRFKMLMMAMVNNNVAAANQKFNHLQCICSFISGHPSSQNAAYLSRGRAMNLRKKLKSPG
jgi:hypothetical protein